MRTTLEFACENCGSKVYREHRKINPGQKLFFCNRKCWQEYKIRTPIPEALRIANKLVTAKQRIGSEELAKRERIRKLRYFQNNVLARKAQAAVHYAVRKDVMSRASELSCIQCGKAADEYHHYLGYEQEHWLDVIPLCYRCHWLARAET